jgi:cell division septation protein DedD
MRLKIVNRFGQLVLVLALVSLGGMMGCGGDDDALPESQTHQTKALVPDSTVENDELPTTDQDVVVQPEATEAVGAAIEQEPVVQPVENVQIEETPQVVEITPAASPEASGAGPFSLQLGSYTVASYAEEISSKLQNLGYPATVEQAEVGGTLYHRVFIRGLADRQIAENLGEELHSSQGLSYLIRRK